MHSYYYPSTFYACLYFPARRNISNQWLEYNQNSCESMNLDMKLACISSDMFLLSRVSINLPYFDWSLFETSLSDGYICLI